MKDAANHLKSSGATIVAVGVGNNVDVATLTDMATSADLAYPAISEVDIEAIRLLAPSETCEVSNPARRRKRDVSEDPVHRSKRAATEERCKIFYLVLVYLYIIRLQ